MKPLSAADPRSVASYRLLGVLGGGGMGRVYLGESRTGRKLAIKVIRAELAEDPVFRRRFAREVAAARLVSPLFTAAVVDADTGAGSPWLATTYIEGPSLEQWVDEHGPLSPRAVLMLAAGLAEALSSIHRVGLVHRDLKPGNVLIDDTGPHIIDFGVALAIDATRMTANLVMGTPSYMAPERINGEEGGTAADLFSLGATLVFASTGATLVRDDTVYAQVMQIVTGRFDLSKVPSDLRPLIVRCLSQRPKDRPTAEELARILVASGISAPSSGWHRTTGPHTTPVLAEPLPATGLSRRRMLAIGGLVGVAVAGVGGFGVLTNFGRPQRQATPPAPTPGPPRRGDVVWQVRSGVRPLGSMLGARAAGVRIVVDRGERVISANDREVTAIDTRGVRRWGHPLPSGLASLQQWGDGVLVYDSRTVTLLDAATGTRRFSVDLAGVEAARPGVEHPDDVVVEVRRIALSATRALVDVGTAVVALDDTGRTVWRTGRAEVAGRLRPAGSPIVANGKWVVTRDVVDTTAHIALLDAATGQRAWLVSYAYEPPQERPDHEGGPGGPGGPPPPPPPGGHDDAWSLVEARLTDDLIVFRDGPHVQALRLRDGVQLWEERSRTPVAGLELVDGTLLVAADTLTAYRVTATPRGPEFRWQVGLRGARIVVRRDRAGLFAVADEGIAEVDLASGRFVWRVDLPPAMAGALPDRLTGDDRVGFLTLRPRGEQAQADLPVDVLGIKLAE